MDRIKKLNLKDHLLTAISYLIPIVSGSGFLIAIGNALGGDAAADLTQGAFNIWDVFSVIGAAGLGLLPVIISTGIAFSIAEKPGIAPGFIVGLTANTVGAGFIGGILGGYIAGYIVLSLRKYMKVPEWAKGLMPLLILPFLGSMIGGLIMVYVIGAPVSWLTEGLTSFLIGLNTQSRLIFGSIVGVLSGIDYGGPINKTVFAFVLTLQAEGINEPITALQLINTATPIGFGFAHILGKFFNKRIYSDFEVETLKSAVPMGVVNIVEGVIPLVLNDIVRGVVATGIGGAVGGAVSLTLGADATVPFGGFLMLPTMSRPWAGVLALLANIVVTAVVLVILKKPLSEDEINVDLQPEEDDIDDSEIQIT